MSCPIDDREGADVDQLRDVMREACLDNVAGAGDGGGFVWLPAAAHRRADMEHHRRANERAIHGVRIAQLAERDLDPRVPEDLGRR